MIQETAIENNILLGYFP